MIAFLALLVGLLSFYKGFFPAKSVLPGFNDRLAPVEPQYSKLVFMVVDAMRADFMFGPRSNMSNCHGFIQSGHGLPLTGYSNPPTVTLPRLKGITTGSAPSFFDAVLNIAETSASALGDSWIHQFVLNNKTIHMYGDDTWLNVFPELFEETEGTSSFFVNDYTEVDNNVTRHVIPSLEASNDWDLLILHYLGLDHIGHKGGPNSPLMGPKQAEMDAIIDQIYNNIDDDTLFIVTGDHGMNEVGNHGGSSQGETSAALLFLSKKQHFDARSAPIEGDGYLFYDMVPQIDLVPTICMLMGLPVPQNSLGLPINELVDSQEYMCAHFHRLLGVEFECTAENLKELQEQNMRASTEYNIPVMRIGIFIISCGMACSLFWLKGLGYLPWAGIVSLYCATLFGTSTIEEEHQFWFWLFVGVCGYSIVQAARSGRTQSALQWAAIVVAARLIRGWHTMGQKWTGNTVSAYLTGNGRVCWILVAFTYLVFGMQHPTDVIGLLAIVLSFGFKLNVAKQGEFYIPEFLSRITHAVPEWSSFLYKIMLAALVARTLFRRQVKFAFELILITQSRLVDIPLFTLFIGIKYCLKRQVKEMRPWHQALVTLSLQYCTFFATGGSNSLATIDLSNAYNGLSSYNIVLVGLLTFISNWTGPIYWSLNGPRPKVWCDFYLTFYYSSALCVTSACYILREHLFVWTVFSPKLLYFGAWVIFTMVESLIYR